MTWKETLAGSGPGVVLGLLVLSLFSPDVLSHTLKAAHVEIVHPWTVETRGETAAVFMKIRSTTPAPDRLLAATTTRAAKALVVTGSGPALEGAWPELPAHGNLELTRAGPHIRLEGLSAPLSPYDHLPMTLVFERAGKVEIEVMVEAAE